MKCFQGTRPCDVLLVLFCCLAADKALFRTAVEQVLFVGRGELAAITTGPFGISVFGSAPYFGLLLHCLLITDTLFTSKVKLIPARGWGLYWGKPVGLGTTTNLTAFLVEDCLL